jgi:hypothetical protein
MTRAILTFLAGAGLTLGAVLGTAHATNDTAPTTTATPAPPVPCEHEDGSGPDQVLPCFWDAGNAGVPGGYSFTVTRGTDGGLCYTYLDPKAQAELGGCEA